MFPVKTRNVLKSKRADNIILTGIMGVGKSVVGLSLACDLGLKYVDTDELIEIEAGITVKEIFEELGEEGFRLIEKKVIEEISTGEHGEGLIVSTGGGAVIDPANRRLLSSFGTVICLKADPEEIIRRLAGNTSRPLLEGGGLHKRLTKLLKERGTYYAEADHTVETTGKDSSEVVSLIKGFLNKSSPL